MTIKTLTLEDVITFVNNQCIEYGDSLSINCVDEILESFYDLWDSCNNTYQLPHLLSGMTKEEAYFYYDIMECIVEKCIKKNLVELKQVPNFV